MPIRTRQLPRLEAGLKCRQEQVSFPHEHDNLSTGTARRTHGRG